MTDFTDNIDTPENDLNPEADLTTETDITSESEIREELTTDLTLEEEAGVLPPTIGNEASRLRLRGMFRNWFLEYASYVILERAVPHIDDGLKPVQRRILHSMKTIDDGRYNKVANIVGNTMQYHPHGDASIKDALVQLGQKELLIDTQGNWGNILTGDDAAAGRYIEARLSPFALEALYNPKITEWVPSYDGRKQEPVTLPVKFPLLLFQGVEGIAVGLSSKILPHNFNELIDASIACLQGKEFKLYPDFPTGGSIDVARYNDGERGGSVKIRAKIEKLDSTTLAITEIPYGKTTRTIIESILKAFEKGKIKIRKVDDNTSDNARILVHLQSGTSSDKAIDALYAFTDCEVAVSPNCCVIDDKKPVFLSVTKLLEHSAHRTRELLGRELEIKLGEVKEQLNFASLERIFIEERIYKDEEFEQGETMEAVVAHIHKRLIPFLPRLVREVTDDDVLRLMEIKMKRILKFSSKEADRVIAQYNDRIEELQGHLDHLTDFTVDWFLSLKEKYGEAFPRRTQIRAFDSIEASRVAEANEKLYFNREEGFIGTSLKKDEFLFNCSMLDDVIIFYNDGRYKVVKVAEKLSIGKGKDVRHIGRFDKSDDRMVYNVIYQDGKGGTYYMKRFKVTGVTRDKEYNLTRGTAGSRISWFSANPNGEAEVVKVTLKPKPRLTRLQFDIDFAELAIKGKQSMGNIVTRNEVHRFSLKEKGTSTLGGRDVWFDRDVLRLNYEGRGEYLGEFFGTDKILVITRQGDYFLTSFDASNHYDHVDILRLEKYRPSHIWTAVHYDADQGFPYLKRFTFEPAVKPQHFIGDNPKSKLILLTDTPGARFSLTFGGADRNRPALEIDSVEFTPVKSFKAKGKRLTSFKLKEVVEIEPREDVEPDAELPENDPTPDDSAPDGENPAAEPEMSDEELRDSIIGQERLF